MARNSARSGRDHTGIISYWFWDSFTQTSGSSSSVTTLPGCKEPNLIRKGSFNMTGGGGGELLGLEGGSEKIFDYQGGGGGLLKNFTASEGGLQKF